LCKDRGNLDATLKISRLHFIPVDRIKRARTICLVFSGYHDELGAFLGLKFCIRVATHGLNSSLSVGVAKQN